MSFVSVAVPVPFLSLLSYRVPEDIDAPAGGARVLVPLGRRIITGCVVDDPQAQPPADRGAADIKDLIDVLDDSAFLPPDVVALAVWVASYYACGPGDAIAAAMPPFAWLESDLRARLTDEGRARFEQVGGGRASRSTRALVLAALVTATSRRRTGGWVSLGSIASRLTRIDRAARPRLLRATLRLLETEGHVELDHPVPDRRAALRNGRADRDPFEAHVIPPAAVSPADDPRLLTLEQAASLARLSDLAARGRFDAALLHGVTGGGKTEVYLRLAAQVRARERGVLVLVPEIGLTPVLAGLFRNAFGDRVAIQHSGLSDGERHDQWQRIRRGQVDVVIGTRSAVFAPLRSLGLIIVDEEHDSSYKQDETPRYHARDVAVMRAKQVGALVVLGSATPSLESAYNARRRRYERVTIANRVLDRPLPSVRLVDMREEYARRGPEVVLSERLEQAIERRLASGEQVLLLLNRRGLATAVFCRQCAGSLECPNCSVSLIVHGDATGRGGTGKQAATRARCHYCNYSIHVPKACPLCAAPYLERLGFGTERVESDLRARFPAARIARLDRDVVRRRGAVGDLLARFAAGEIDVLVGTQMIAKGHDFPRVTLVGVVSADVGLGLPDFRAGERTFQLLTQVVGRAGRGDTAGEAIIQTLYPDHYSIVRACGQDYEGFFDDELRYRRAMRYPPIVALVNAVVRGRTFRLAMEEATALAERLRSSTRGLFRVLGPAPAPLVKLRGEHRVQLFLKGTSRAAMREALMAAVDRMPQLRRRVIVDVDPVSVL